MWACSDHKWPLVVLLTLEILVAALLHVETHAYFQLIIKTTVGWSCLYKKKGLIIKVAGRNIR